MVGYGRVGRELSRLLQDRGVPLVLVESDPDRVEQALKRGLVTVRGNAASATAVLAAAAVRVLGSLLLLKFFGAVDDPRMAFWSGLVCDWPSKLLFYYAFLTSRPEV